MSPATFSQSPIPVAAGIGLRSLHMPAFAAEDAHARRTIPWLEVHSENFLSPGGPRRAMLAQIAARYPISCHGVGLSLGSAEGLDDDHLTRLRHLYAWVKPSLISEHLAWSVTGGVYLNDLLPLPYTAETLDIVSGNVARAQDAFGQRLLIENPSAYVHFTASDMPEADFLNALVKRTGCGLLLDVNNIYVTAANTGGDAAAYLAAIDATAVGEIHLAGHSSRGVGDDTVLIDTHGAAVCAGVWDLYGATLKRIGPRPTLIEWDTDVPELNILLAEAAQADKRMIAATGASRVA